MRIRLLVFLVVLAASAAATPVTAAAGGDAVKADLEGKPIRVGDIADWWCHDGDYPQLHCFRSADALEASLAAKEQDGLALLAATASTYAVVYSGQSYSGSYLYVSQDYDTLAVVGWNDRIRSYKGRNSGEGSFYTDWFATGSRLDFCCNATIPALSATFDRAITSVYRR